MKDTWECVIHGFAHVSLFYFTSYVQFREYRVEPAQKTHFSRKGVSTRPPMGVFAAIQVVSKFTEVHTHTASSVGSLVWGCKLESVVI